VTESPANFHLNQSQPFLKSFSCNFLSIFPAHFHLNQSQQFIKSFFLQPPLKLALNGNFWSLGSLKYSTHLEGFDFFFLKKVSLFRKGFLPL